MFGKKTNKPKGKQTEKEKYFTDRKYRRDMMKKKKRSSSRFWSLLVLFIVGFFVFSGLYIAYLYQDLPSLSSLENPKTDIATRIYSEDGELIDQFYLQNRTAVQFENIPKDMINALIATEDRKFYNHWGVDMDRIAKAFVKNIMAFHVREGASTITQQLARNLYASIGTKVSITRKLREAITAVQIEKTYTKNEILVMYLNQVYFGRGAYGVEAAARTYYDKSSSELTLDECATLIGILKS